MGKENNPLIINAVIVTYNRKELLVRCLNSVINQTVQLSHIYLIDNASTDGTDEYLMQHGFIANKAQNTTQMIRNIMVHYVCLDNNSGGAGGFCTGMQTARHGDPDYMWIMDDDGFPAPDCLEMQLKLVGSYDYVMPISLDTEEQDILTWLIRKKDKQWTCSYNDLLKSYNNGLMDHIVPFNGLLMSRRLIKKVGYPKKEMFIWGDDFEHLYRCQKEGFKAVTTLNAIFFHPRNNSAQYRIFFGTIPLVYTESKLKFTCLIRNSTYNYWNYKGKYLVFIKFLMYSWFFLIKKPLHIRQYLYYLKCVNDGIRGDFSRHKQFLQ